MKKVPAAIALGVVAVALGAFLALPASGQAAPAGTGDLKARVSSILERFPAGSAAVKDALCAEILGLGPANFSSER
jgi:hypothetical protein